ncbi:MAG: tetratricopeptide repeat protein [Balneolaceae bacterium]
MKYTFLSRKVSALLTFGIFFAVSCSTLTQSSKPPHELYHEGNYDQALEQVNRTLADDPQREDLQLLKVSILTAQAKNLPQPERRTLPYRNAYDTKNLQIHEPALSDSAHSLLLSAWSFEQDAALTILQQESRLSDQQYRLAKSHLENALTVLPDSSAPYSLLSTLSYRQGETDQALLYLQQAVENDAHVTEAMLEKQAYLYMETGNLERSAELYEQLVDQFGTTDTYTHGLLNAYILQERHEKAIELLSELRESHPTRPFYLEALAVQSYYQSRREFEQDNDIDSFAADLARISDMFEELMAMTPFYEERTHRAATFYSNATRQLLEHGRDSFADKAAQFAASSVQHWQQLMENDPENRAYAVQLARAYRAAGMTNEAELLEQQYNL